MRRWTDLLRSKGFYIALGTGIIAFASLIVMYTNNNPGKDVTKEQAIDLNQAEVGDETDGEDNGNSIAANTDPKKKDNTEAKVDETPEEKPDKAADDKADNSDATSESDTEQTTEGTTEELAAAEEPDESTDATAVNVSAFNGETLAWPVPGNVIMEFSMDTTIYYKTLDTYRCNPGIMIASSEGANVCAAYDGVVEAIEDTKEYGTVMTIDMGNGYKAKYGQLMNIRVREGDVVGVNQIIAEVAPVSGYFVEEGCNLYFELTREGEAINPIQFME